MTYRQSFASLIAASTAGLLLATAAHAQTATTGSTPQLHEADQTFITDGTQTVSTQRDDPNNTALDTIKNLRGADFDKAYIEQFALAGQQKALSAFQAEIASGRDAQLKSAASKALPTVQADYAQAQQLAQRKHLTQ